MKNNALNFFFFVSVLFAGSLQSAYYSQNGQDSYIHSHFFPDKKDGFFVEIGAHNGVTYSNTYFFEKQGWKGICVEPIPEAFQELQINRKALCINGCITDFSGPGIFLRVHGYSEMLSGLLNKYDPRHAARIKRELQKYGGSAETIEVNCFILNDLLKQNNILHVDYVSIDTEGGELDILKTIDFDSFSIDIISVEDNFHDSRIKDFLQKKGFIFITKVGDDLIFRNKQFVE